MGELAPPSRPLIDQLSRTTAARGLAWANRVPAANAATWAIALADDVPRQGRIALERGQRLAAIARRLAYRSGDRLAQARTLRAEGHALALAATFPAALHRYAHAIRLFDARGERLQQAITYSGAVPTLGYLGRYDQALQWAARARAIFRRLGDGLRLARLESNVGNIHFRQDRFRQALGCYRRAEAALRRYGQHQDAAEAMRNIAVCLTSLNAFDEALEAYANVRAFAESQSLSMLVAAADYNIAYLYFLCGRYTEALTAYADARVRSDALGDRYHRALCDLDEAEVCLELNDLTRARTFAEAAAKGFSVLGMRYERAKALVFLAAARARQGDGPAALKVFSRARVLFAVDRNSSWLAAVDLGRAMACFQMGRYAQAHRLTSVVRRELSASARVTWHVLRARQALVRGDIGAAARASRAAVSGLRRVPTPAIEWQVQRIVAEVAEARGDYAGAANAFAIARRELDHLRAEVPGDELKVPFLGDKLAVYEGLVQVTLGTAGGPTRDADAFHLIEEAKSRSLVELLAFRTPELRTRRTEAGVPAGTVRVLHQELHAYRRRLTQASMTARPDAPRVRELRREVQRRERRLSAALTRLGQTDVDLASLHTGASATTEDIQAALPEDTTILEYYAARGQIYACVVDAGTVRVVPVARVDDVTRTLQLLRFQLAKFQLGPDYVRTFASVLSAATTQHLRQLYAQLVAPVRDRLQTAHLVVVPHGALHYLPFHALDTGAGALIDAYSISYAPSASVFRQCQLRAPSAHTSSVVLALADGYAPHISQEAAAVARCLPDATLRTGADATADALRTLGASSRYVHVATHGFFRRDNPMLSAIRLADGDLTLADTYGLSLDADLVTLSGCGTGLSAVIGGDELVGLMRGLLFAGARSLMLTMWQVDDLSTSEFMTAFYRHLASGHTKAAAARHATQAVRERFAHPYYWAPFSLIGHATGERLAAGPGPAAVTRGKKRA